MAPAMEPVESANDVPSPDRSDRPVIVGLLPHPFCNPTVRGCGFCTFPHQKFDRPQSDEIVRAVATELQTRTAALPWLRDAKVSAVYIGGGTANLVEPERMQTLYDALGTTFDLTDAEVSLEGAPRYFTTWDAEHLDRLAELDVGHRRISMGVQTFDAAWIDAMGRQAIGAPEHVEAAVEAAQDRGLTTSCDLLYNLPGQPREAMLADVERAAELGFDQICVYHLVLYHGLGTVWSQDDEMVDAVPSMPAAADNWLAVRERLHELGYRQSTLTNFEREDLPDAKRFRYERLSFQPDDVDGIGFGPAGITTFASSATPWKTLNASDATAYLAAVHARGEAVASAFEYAFEDRELLSLTRQIPSMSIRRDRFREQFRMDMTVRYSQELDALDRRGLVSIAHDTIHLTPRGMFYADSVAGLLAWRRTEVLRRFGSNDAAPHHMG